MDPKTSESTTHDPLATSETEYSNSYSETDTNDRVTSAALVGEPSLDEDAGESILGGTGLGADTTDLYDGRERDLDSEDASREEPFAGIVSGSPYESVSSGTSVFETDAPVSPKIVTTTPDSQPTPSLSQTVGQTSDQIKQTAGQVGDQVKQTAGQVVEQAKSQATDFVSTAKQQLNSQLSAQKDNTAKRLDGFTETLRQTGQSFQDKGEAAVGTLVTGLADQIDGASGYLKQRDVDQITRETETFARQQPGLFLGLAFVAGVAVARFLKSTQSPTY